MSTIINCSIDVDSISADKIVKHANGKRYWKFSVMERKEPDQYGNTHYVIETQSKDERDAKAPKNYLGSSGKAFTFGQTNGSPQVASNDVAQDDNDLPF